MLVVINIRRDLSSQALNGKALKTSDIPNSYLKSDILAVSFTFMLQFFFRFVSFKL